MNPIELVREKIILQKNNRIKAIKKYIKIIKNKIKKITNSKKLIEKIKY